MTDAVKWLQRNGLDVDEMKLDWLQRLALHQPAMELNVGELLKNALLRSRFIMKFGFAIITEDVIEAIRPFAPLVEVGAGSGYWTYELTKAGVDVVATDPGTGRYLMLDDNEHERVGHWNNRRWTDVKELTAIQAIDKYRDRSLLTVWPDIDTWPAAALEHYGGSTVIYVGEYNGCTASERFHELLGERFEEVVNLLIPHFNGLYDSLSIWQRV